MRRIYEIDFLRFFAAIIVVFYHYTFTGNNFGNMPQEFSLFAGWTKYGYLGVDLFFMISGFVILLSAQKKGPWGFIKSRIVRLYPVFWVGVTLTALTIHYDPNNLFTVSLKQYLLNLPMIGGFFDVIPMDNVYWTLIVELKFYLLIFILICFKQVKKIQLYLFGWTIITLLLLVFPEIPKISALFIPEWAPYFISGAVLFLIKQRGHSKALISLLIINYIMSMYNAYEYTDYLGTILEGDFSFPIIATIITFFFILMYLVVIDKLHILNKPQMVILGALTYPLYVIHQKIGFILFSAIGNRVNDYLLLVIIILGMLIVSYIIHKAIEIPLSNQLNKLLTRKKESAK